MSSGVDVNDQVVTIYNGLQKDHKYNWVIFKIADSGSEIVVDYYEEDKEKTFDDLCTSLSDDEPRYVVYDFKFQLKDEGAREKVVFIFWCPDTAKIKKKMVYASSKGAIKKKLTGIAEEVQANGREDLDYEEILQKVSKGKKK